MTTSFQSPTVSITVKEVDSDLGTGWRPATPSEKLHFEVQWTEHSGHASYNTLRRSPKIRMRLLQGNGAGAFDESSWRVIDRVGNSIAGLSVADEAFMSGEKAPSVASSSVPRPTPTAEADATTPTITIAGPPASQEHPLSLSKYNESTINDPATLEGQKLHACLVIKQLPRLLSNRGHIELNRSKITNLLYPGNPLLELGDICVVQKRVGYCSAEGKRYIICEVENLRSGAEFGVDWCAFLESGNTLWEKR